MPPSAWPKAVPLLVLAGLCAYANCVSKTFVFDDDAWIVDHANLDHPTEYLDSIKGRLLLGLTNLALHNTGRNNPLAHHVLNVLIHLAATLTLYALIRRSLLSPRFKGRFVGRAEYLAFGAALLWMLHPLQVQCVTYVIQRCESMAGLFYLLILYALVRGNAVGAEPFAAVHPNENEPHGCWRWLELRRAGWYTLAVVSLALGFLSKEIMVTAPAAVLLYDRVFLTRSIRLMVRRRWAFYLFFILTWAGFTAWHLYRASGSEGGIGFGIEKVTPRQYALTQPGVLLYYLRLSVWPTGMSIDYQSWPWSHTLTEAMPEIAIVGGLLLLTLILLFWRPAAGFVCMWFFLILAPTSSILPIVDAVFEHRMYLSLASVTIWAVLLGDWILRNARLDFLRPYALAAAAMALGVLTFLRNEEYRSRAAVWEKAVQRMPNSVRAKANLGQGLMVDERYEEVPPVLLGALALTEHDPTSLTNLAATYEQLGDFPAAADCYRRLRDFYSKDAKNWRMYGAGLLTLGKWEEAEENFREAIRLEPDVVDAHYGLAAALMEMGREDQMMVAIRVASAINPDWPEIVLGLARRVILDQRLRNHPDARRSALTWARLGIRFIESPQSVHLDTVGLCYAGNGDFDRAAEQSRWALLLSPGGAWGSVHRDRLRDYQRKHLPWAE
jgi:protein O-mannosyl-transferase